MPNIEEYLDLIDAVVAKYTKRGEPVRDRIEWSIACEAFILHAHKYDPTKCSANYTFSMWICWIVRRRIIDHQRQVKGVKKQKELATVPLDGFDRAKGGTVESDLALTEIVLRLPQKQYEAVIYLITHGHLPVSMGYHHWTKAKVIIAKEWAG